jgi:SpoVK/Ycf46/Vps4 family AAA+-type ATPase
VFADELELLLRSRFTLICVVSREEERVLHDIKAACERGGRALFSWDHAEYFRPLSGSPPNLPRATDPLSALEAIDKLKGQAVAVLQDFHQCWDRQPRVVRKLRSLARRFKYTRKSLIVTMPGGDVPAELKDDAVLIDYPPPDVKQLEVILDHILKTPGAKSNFGPGGKEQLVRSALGLSASQAQRAFAKALVSTGDLDEGDIEFITREKKQIIRDSGALEFYAAEETEGDVGGLGRLKEWLHLRKSAFTQKAVSYGLPAPKGLALIGIPGSGKSLSAKMTASLWNMPLIRMDVGALFGGLVGQSEENARRALRLAETVSPCVLWIDEIEKALATGEGDSGTSMRVFGTLLSWMQDKKKPVFVVATANDIGRVPPELLRRGRFDEVFFLDLPNNTERMAIFAVHIRKRGRDPGDYDLNELAAAADGYVGAEIEQSVIDAMYAAFNDEKQPGREFGTGDITRALAAQIPMSRSQKENIAALRSWLDEGRASSASYSESDPDGQEELALQIQGRSTSKRMRFDSGMTLEITPQPFFDGNGDGDGQGRSAPEDDGLPEVP